MTNLANSVGVVGLLAMAAAVAACWRQVAGFLRQGSNYFVGCAFIEWTGSRAVFAYLSSRGRLPCARPRWFDGSVFYVRSRRRREMVMYESMVDTTTIAFYGWAPILIVRRNNGGKNSDSRPASIWWLRGTVDIDRLLREASEHFNEREHSSETNKRFRVIRKVGRGTFGRRMGSGNNQGNEPSVARAGAPDQDAVDSIRHGAAVPVSCAASDISVDAVSDMRAFEVYSFDDDVLRAVDEVKQWRQSGDWYRERGIPWTRGWLLVSPPGTGKTSLLRAIAQELDLPVYLFDLASMSNEEFTDAWREVGSNSPSMVVFEDLDGVFHGRANILGEQGGGLTFDCLLNSISGIAQSDGVFTAFTTNDISKIDPAIAQPATDGGTTRPGRVDRIIEMGPMSEKCRRRHAERVLAGTQANIDAIVRDGEGKTAAQFNDLCVRWALAEFWGREPLPIASAKAEKPVQRAATEPWRIPAG